MLHRARARTAAFGFAITMGLLPVTVSGTSPGLAASARPTVSAVSPSAGPSLGGTGVTVFGRHLLHARRVVFGDVAGSKLRVLSDTSLMVVSPPQGVRTVNVRVVTDAGASAIVRSDVFRYGLAPAVSRVTPVGVSTTGGVTVTVTGSHFAGARQVLFGAVPGTSVRVRSSSQLTVLAPRHVQGVVNVHVVTAYGTSLGVAGDQLRFGQAPQITQISPASGPSIGGTTVTINGTYLTGTTAALFGGVSAQSLQVVSPTRLTMVTSAHSAGAVLVHLRNPYGMSRATSQSSFTFADTGSPPPTAPRVTGLSPAIGDIAGGTSVALSGDGLGTATSVLFDGLTGSHLILRSDSSLTVDSPAHAAGTVEVQVVTRSGTSAAVPADRFTYVYPPNPPPSGGGGGGDSSPGGLRGLVRGVSPAAGLANVIVEISPVTAGDARYTNTSGDGSYSVSGLTPGQYDVCFFPQQDLDPGYVGQCFSGAPIDGSHSPSPVLVSSGAVTPHVDGSLRRAGGISGTVSGPNQVGIAGIVVALTANDGSGPAAFSTTASDGTYAALGLQPGEYTVCFASPSGAGPAYIAKCYDGGAPTSPVIVAAGTVTPAIDASLVSAGSVSGRVTGADGSRPVGGVDVEVTPTAAVGSAMFASTGADGTYSVTGLAAGIYNVCFYPPPDATTAYVGQCFDGAPIDGSTVPTTVAVQAGSTASGINAVLATSGGISGIVTANLAGLNDVDVEVYPVGSVGVQTSAATGSDGSYLVTGLPAGTYTVCFYPTSTYVSQCYNGKVIDGTSVPDSVLVNSGATTSSVDGALTDAGSVSGTVTNGTTGLPGVDVEVDPIGAVGSTHYATTALDGTYRLTRLPAGTYNVCFYSAAGPGSGFSSECHSGDPITVTAGGTASHVDAVLNAGGGIAGTVRSAGVGVPGVDVEVTPSGITGSQTSTVTARDGTYAVSGLPAGNYTICFYPDAQALMAQCYDGAPTDGSVTPISLPVTSGVTTSGIDSALVSP